MTSKGLAVADEWKQIGHTLAENLINNSILAGAVVSAWLVLWRLVRPPVVRMLTWLRHWANTGQNLATLTDEFREHADITNQKFDDLAGKFAAVETGFEITLDDRGQAVFRTDADGKCVHVSRGYCRLYGRTPGECLGDGWKVAIPPESREIAISAWEQSVTERRGFEDEFVVVRGDGERITVFIQSRPVWGPAREYLGHYGVVREASV